MTEKLRAHDFTPSETVRPRRRHKPWHVRLLLALVYLLWGWWTGKSLMSGIAPYPMEHIKIYRHGRQAVWQLVRLPISLLIFLYVSCCIISGHAASLIAFRAFLSHIFGFKGGL
jgi:hypothetical protein